MKTFKLFLLVIIPAILMSCSNANNRNRNNERNNNRNNQSSPRSEKDTVSQGSFLFRLRPAVQNEDKDFVREAGIGGLMEVQAGKLAQERATNPRVKNFGAMMVKDHSKGNADLEALATSKNIDVPSALDNKHQKKVDDLQSEDRNNFDKTYMKEMVDDHQEDIELFQKESKSGNDPSIKEFASKTLPMLQLHLDSAKSIQRDLK